MNRDDIQKLLGGYATGTLTPEEQHALFEAALTDQELFDALAREQALRDVLSDPTARAHLLAAIDDVPAPWYRQWWRPMVVMAAAVLAVAGVAIWEHSREPKPLTVAKVELPRFRPPAATGSAAPILPPPPEVKRAVPAMNLPPLPAPKPVPPPARQVAIDFRSAAPPRPAFAAPAASPQPPPVQGGSISGGPMQQAQQSQTQAQLKTSNSLLPQNSVPVRGTVTDASGAAIPSAQVVVRSLDTGQTVNTSTDDRGAFNAPELQGTTYLVTASAPGFQSATLRDVTATPVNLTLRVGASTETVEVTAAAESVQLEARPTAPRAGLAGAGLTMKKAKSVATPAIACQLLRQVPGGKLKVVPAGGNVPPGSSLILRITPPADGYLRIEDGDRTFANSTARRGVATDISVPPPEKPGRVELHVYFATEQTEAKQDVPHVTVTFNVR
jgi:hypothetical protein